MISVSITPETIASRLEGLFASADAQRIITPDRLKGLQCTAGIQFLFDSRGNYEEELNKWQLERALRTTSPHTRATRSSALKAVAGWFEERNLRWQDCTELAHVNLMRQFFRGDGAKVSKSTWNQWMSHWYEFVRFAEKNDYIEGVSFDRSDLTETGTSVPNVRALSPADYRLFTQAASTQRMQAGCAVCIGTGMRVAELASLKLSQIPNPAHPKFSGRSYLPALITGKGDKTRTIYWPIQAIKRVTHYLNQERSLAVEALKARVESGALALENTFLIKVKDPTTGAWQLNEPNDAPLWLAENGDPLSYNRWGKDFRKASKKVAEHGIYCSPHHLRHTYAVVILSMLIKSQIRQELIDQQLGHPNRRVYFFDPLREVKERLGHASIETTMIYLDHIAEHRALIQMAVADLQTVYLDA